MSKTYTVCLSCLKLNRVPVEAPSQKAPICGHCKADLSVKNGITELSASGLTRLAEKSPLPVVVDFWAPWCGPCLAFAPVYQEAALEMSAQAVFAKLNTEAHPLAGDLHKVRGIPTLMVFYRGLERARQSGAMPKFALIDWLNRSLPRVDEATV